MKKLMLLVFTFALLVGSASVANAGLGSPDKVNGWTPYTDIHVTWDGDSAHLADWDLDTNVDGIIDVENPSALEMYYNFEFKGKTLLFEETYVEAAPAFPQTHHVVLNDNDGDGTYEGAITARYDAPWSSTCPTRMDVIEYWITPEDFGAWGSFYYIEHEYCLPTS